MTFTLFLDCRHCRKEKLAVACFHKSFLALNDLGGHIGGTNVLETNPCKAKTGILLIAMPQAHLYMYGHGKADAQFYSHALPLRLVCIATNWLNMGLHFVFRKCQLVSNGLYGFRAKPVCTSPSQISLHPLCKWLG